MALKPLPNKPIKLVTIIVAPKLPKAARIPHTSATAPKIINGNVNAELISMFCTPKTLPIMKAGTYD
jgi:hypothetical protein